MTGDFSKRLMKYMCFAILFVALQSEFGYVSAMRHRGIKKCFGTTCQYIKEVGLDMKKKTTNVLYNLRIFKKKDTWAIDEKYIQSAAQAILNYKVAKKIGDYTDAVCKHAAVAQDICVMDINIYAQKCLASEGLSECYRIPTKHIGPDGMVVVYNPHVLAFAIKLFTRLRRDLQYHHEAEQEGARWWNIAIAKMRRFFRTDNTIKYFSDSHLKNRIFNSTPKHYLQEGKFGPLNEYIQYGILNYGMLLGRHHKLGIKILQSFVNVGLIRNIFAFFFKRKLKEMGIKPTECADVGGFEGELTEYLENFNVTFAKLGTVVANAMMGGYVATCAAMQGFEGMGGEGAGLGGEEGVVGGQEGEEGVVGGQEGEGAVGGEEGGMQEMGGEEVGVGGDGVNMGGQEGEGAGVGGEEEVEGV